MSVFVQFLVIDSSHLCDTVIDQPSSPPLSSLTLIHPVPFHILLWFTFNSTDYLEFNNIKIHLHFYILVYFTIKSSLGTLQQETKAWTRFSGITLRQDAPDLADVIQCVLSQPLCFFLSTETFSSFLIPVTVISFCTFLCCTLVNTCVLVLSHASNPYFLSCSPGFFFLRRNLPSPY